MEQYTGPSTADVTFGPRPCRYRGPNTPSHEYDTPGGPSGPGGSPSRPRRHQDPGQDPDPDKDDDGEGPSGPGGSLSWLALLRARWRRDDKESLVCYFLFVALFVADMSLLALAFPAALYLYALLVNPPARQFWQVWRPRASPWFRYQARWCLLVIIFPANLI